MAMLETNATTAIASNALAPATANGPILFTFSGTRGPLNKQPTIDIWSRSDTADFVSVLHESGFGRFRVNFAAGDEWFYLINTNGCTIDLAAVDL